MDYGVDIKTLEETCHTTPVKKLQLVQHCKKVRKSMILWVLR